MTLNDADPTAAGQQPFGDFINGEATNNSTNTGDGTYTIESTNNSGQITEIGSFVIEANSLQPGEDLDSDGADDSFEEGKDLNQDGIDDSVQDNVATFQGSDEASANVLELVNPIGGQISNNKEREKEEWGINNMTKLVFQGIAAPRETRTQRGKTINGLQKQINNDKFDFKSLGLTPSSDVVIATSDQPAFTIIPEINKEGIVPKQQEKRFTEETNKEFQEQIHQVEAILGEKNNWNAVFKPDANGINRFIGYDPVTGLGAILSDKDNNGKPDGVTMFLKDNEPGDLNPDPFVIDDPLGLAELAAEPKLVVDQSSTLDGNPILRVEGINGTGLWLKLDAIKTDASLQNSLELLNETGDSLGSIGGTARSKDLGGKLVYIPSGGSLLFQQATGGQKDIQKPSIKIKEKKNGNALISLNDNASDSDYDDLIISVSSRIFASDNELQTIKTTRHQSTSSRGIIDFSQIESDVITVEISSETASFKDNKLALVRLDPNTDQKNYSVQGVSQNDGDFLDIVKSNLIELQGESFTTIRDSDKGHMVEWELTSEEAGLYAPVLITEDNNLFTFGATTAVDKLQHLKVFGDNHFGFEDLLAKEKPDWDYNDFRVKFSIL